MCFIAIRNFHGNAEGDFLAFEGFQIYILRGAKINPRAKAYRFECDFGIMKFDFCAVEYLRYFIHPFVNALVAENSP